jgi:putative molybdopterin biosynthesis protein
MDKKDRNIYLSSLKLEEAKNAFFKRIDLSSLINIEEIPVGKSLNRVSINPSYAKLSSPHYNASAMDGVMVKSELTYGVDERNPKRLKLNTDFVYVDTGDVINDPFDSVIMIEDVHIIDDETIEILQAASPWQHVRPIGEDIVKSEMVIPAYHKIRPVDIGALLSGGIFNIEVVKKPSVGILPTGTEIVEPTLDLIPGEIIDSNSQMFESLVLEHGGIPTRYQAIADDYEKLKAHIKNMAEVHDIVLINAGSSAGSEDYTVKIIRELGEVSVHGVAIKPGKPAILGMINNKPVIGIPGYPVSAFFVYDIYVKELLYKWQKQPNYSREKIKATLSKRLMSSLKHREYIRMKLGLVDNKIIATPLNRGAGVTMSLVKADAICVVDQNIEGYEAGMEVEVELLRDIKSINKTLVSIGSHDILLDVLSDLMSKNSVDALLSSTHVGSMGGIMAMMKGETHIAPIHLLNEETGVYNKDFINKYLKNQEVLLIKGVSRIQGLYIHKKNRKSIEGIEDLSREDVTFVNRQKGSGTRLLLDYHLKKNGLKKDKIKGYNREMTTHMTVASAVKSRTADAGMGIESVARVMDLGFIPVGEESYDFIVTKEVYEKGIFKNFLDILVSDEFRNKLESIGGYKFENVGEIIHLD